MSENNYYKYSDTESENEYENEEKKEKKILSKAFDLLKSDEKKYKKKLPPVPPRKHQKHEEKIKNDFTFN